MQSGFDVSVVSDGAQHAIRQKCGAIKSCDHREEGTARNQTSGTRRQASARNSNLRWLRAHANNRPYRSLLQNGQSVDCRPAFQHAEAGGLGSAKGLADLLQILAMKVYKIAERLYASDLFGDRLLAKIALAVEPARPELGATCRKEAW